MPPRELGREIPICLHLDHGELGVLADIEDDVAAAKSVYTSP
jgi:fructose/tagatose bisphosphate aldolase